MILRLYGTVLAMRCRIAFVSFICDRFEVFLNTSMISAIQWRCSHFVEALLAQGRVQFLATGGMRVSGILSLYDCWLVDKHCDFVLSNKGQML